jgi:hypothetical protein
MTSYNESIAAENPSPIQAVNDQVWAWVHGFTEGEQSGTEVVEELARESKWRRSEGVQVLMNSKIGDCLLGDVAAYKRIK